jgi:hypothetical protein
LYEKQSDGSGEDRLLLETEFNASPVDWSLDGRYIVYLTSGGPTRWDVWVLPTFGDRKPVRFLGSTFSEFEAKISPDSRWMAYTSNESGRREIYIQAFPGPSGKWQVSTQGGRDPQWRHDGKGLFFISRDGKMMWVDVSAETSLQVGVPKPLFDAIHTDTQEGRDYAITPDGLGFLIVKPDRAKSLPATTVVVNWTAGLKER